MAIIEFRRRRIFFFVGAIALVFLFFNLSLFSSDDLRETVKHVPIIGSPKSTDRPPKPSKLPTFPSEDEVESTPSAAPPPQVPDSHPITKLMEEADKVWRDYEGSRSSTFRQTVERYRSKNGRHPPPGFKQWYMFARKRNTFHIDDFDQIMDDLRPFWAIEPKVIRTHAAHMWENEGDGAAGLHIRNHKVAKVNSGNWRTDTMADMIKTFVEYLPDMDIAMNRLDQPRVIVPWDDMQKLLAKELETRFLGPDAVDSFTDKQEALLDLSLSKEEDKSERLNANWLNRAGKPYMEIAARACPPDSPARNSEISNRKVDAMYKEPLAGIVSNFNLSSDLCTVGNQLARQHGLLYSASSIMASHTLVPIFGECKVNINSDILFPANMYYRDDERYVYNDKEDIPWADKDEVMVWRGVTSGGVGTVETWETMHRQRLVRLLNGTFMAENKSEVKILTQSPASTMLTEVGTYEATKNFKPQVFANDHTDVGFTETWGCVPDCSMYKDVFRLKDQIPQTRQFRRKYLIDVDGHSFSGRWHAFLQSQSLGFKATIFREWHDSRLFAWRHFVPVDNRYDDIYSLLTYFIGVGKKNNTEILDDPQSANLDSGLNPGIYMPKHQTQAKRLADQGREWAKTVLRREDIEVYMFRLMLEYARICDDNRDRIGYGGDGSELDKFDGSLGKHAPGSFWGLGDWYEKVKEGAHRWKDAAVG